jgi:integrase
VSPKKKQGGRRLYVVGTRGLDRVWVQLRPDGAYMIQWMGSTGRRKSQKIGYDLGVAKTAADDKSTQLHQEAAAGAIDGGGAPQPQIGGTPFGSLGWASRVYEKVVLGSLQEAERAHHVRAIEMFERHTGSETLLADLTAETFVRYGDARSRSAESPDLALYPELRGAHISRLGHTSEAVWTDAAGKVVRKKVPPPLIPQQLMQLARARQQSTTSIRGWQWPTPVSLRSVERDHRVIRRMLQTAVRHAATTHRTFLECPAAGVKIKRTKSSMGFIYSEADYEKLLAVADQVHPDLRDLVVTCHESGRRISTVVALMSDHVFFDGAGSAICWERDKIRANAGVTVRISSELRDTLAARFAGLGLSGDERRPVFPAGHTGVDAWRAMDEAYALAKLKKAAKLAQVRLPTGAGWHGFRRKFATDLMGEPLKSVMTLGGWSDPTVLQEMYQFAGGDEQSRALQARAAQRREKISPTADSHTTKGSAA